MTNYYSLDLERSSSQFAAITDAAQTGLDITGNLTFEAWVKIEQRASTLGSLMVIAGKWNFGAANQRSWRLFLDNTDDKVRLQVSNDGTFNTPTTISGNTAFVAGDVGKWKHIAVAFTAATPTAAVYFNGQSVGATVHASGSTSIFNSTAAYAIGADYNNGTPADFFDGKIDDVRVWNTTRSASQIAAFYNRPLVGNEANLVAYHKLESNYLDQTANNNDLTASGSPVFTTDLPFTGSGASFLYNFM